MIWLVKLQMYMVGSAQGKLFIALSMRHIIFFLGTPAITARYRVHPQEIPLSISLPCSPGTCIVKSHQNKTPVNPSPKRRDT